jgi:TRAP-type C4-dicarboxylate transport system substrate-binding protein
MALSTGLVDAQENPLTQIYTMRFFEVQRYLMLSAHMLAVSSTIISQRTWNSLSPGDQQIVQEVFRDMATHIEEMVVQNEENLIRTVEGHGMTVIRNFDARPFRARVPLVLNNFPAWVELYNEIQRLDR